MSDEKRPAKDKDVLSRIRLCIAKGKYALTLHALDRQGERLINLPETLHVLKTGHEEKQKSGFDKEHNTWKYAIKGKTLRDKIAVRVVVAFDADNMLIITVIRLENSR